MPKYFEEFICDTAKYNKERPSNILQTKFDDRKIIPRIGFKNANNTIITYINVYNIKTGEPIGECYHQVCDLARDQPDKEEMVLINSTKNNVFEK